MQNLGCGKWDLKQNEHLSILFSESASLKRTLKSNSSELSSFFDWVNKSTFWFSYLLLHDILFFFIFFIFASLPIFPFIEICSSSSTELFFEIGGKAWLFNFCPGVKVWASTAPESSPVWSLVSSRDISSNSVQGSSSSNVNMLKSPDLAFTIDALVWFWLREMFWTPYWSLFSFIWLWKSAIHLSLLVFLFLITSTNIPSLELELTLSIKSTLTYGSYFISFCKTESWASTTTVSTEMAFTVDGLGLILNFLSWVKVWASTTTESSVEIASSSMQDSSWSNVKMLKLLRLSNLWLSGKVLTPTGWPLLGTFPTHLLLLSFFDLLISTNVPSIELEPTFVSKLTSKHVFWSLFFSKAEQEFSSSATCSLCFLYLGQTSTFSS